MHVKMKFKFFSCFGHTFSLLHTWHLQLFRINFLAGLSFFLQSHGYQYMYVVPLITQLWQKYWVYYPIWQNRYMKDTCLVLFPLHILVCSELVKNADSIPFCWENAADISFIHWFRYDELVFKIPPDWSVWLMLQLHVLPSHNPQNHAFSFLTYIQRRSSQ